MEQTRTSSSLWYEAANSAATRVAWNDARVEDKRLLNAADRADWEKLVLEKRKEGEQLLGKVASNYAKSQEKDSDRRWVFRAGKFGTSADKLAALTVMVQDNPAANLRALDSLLGMVTSKGGKRHAVTGIIALKELFVTNLLPDRKLKYLSQQPLSSLPETKAGKNLLLYWFLEDSLKQRYEKYVAALEESSKDSLLVLKKKAVEALFDLLKSKPEQERRLLAALVNKLGDPERKVASNSSYMLSRLLSEHPNMKAVVVEEVDSFVFRPHVGLRAKYYAAVFLNQIVLSSKGDGTKLAKRLIDLYFALFRTLANEDTKAAANPKKDKKVKGKDIKSVKSPGRLKAEAGELGDRAEIDSRLLSALLTGINRAFPFVAPEEVDMVIQSHSPLLFRLVHAENLNVGVQALILLHQLLSKHLVMSDRFYRALYDVLQRHDLFKSSKVEMFIGLLFKAMKADINSTRVAAFVKRLMQVAMQQPPQYACGALLMVSEVLKARPSLWGAILQPESNDEEDEHFVDVPDDGEDVGVLGTDRPMVDIRSKDIPAAQNGVLARGGSDESGSDAEEMVITNYDDSDEADSSSEDEPESKSNRPKVQSKDLEKQDKGPLTDGQSIRKEMLLGSAQNGDGRKVEAPAYNPRSREPAHCNADRACWWELSALAMHVHPSVAAMAKTLLAGANVVYSGDPLRDFCLGVFLDRFAEKKPKVRKGKESGTWHGSSMSFPIRTIESSSSLPVGEQFLSIAQADVAPEDVVFHKFYLARAAQPSRSKKKKQKEQTEDNDIVGLGSGDDEGASGDDSDEDAAAIDSDEGASGDDSDEDAAAIDSDEGAAADDSDECAAADDSDNDEVDALLELGEGGEDAGGLESADSEYASSHGDEYDYDKLDAAVAKDDGRDAKLSDESEGFDDGGLSDSGMDSGFENLEDALDDVVTSAEHASDEDDAAGHPAIGKRRRGGAGKKSGARVSPFVSLEEHNRTMGKRKRRT